LRSPPHFQEATTPHHGRHGHDRRASYSGISQLFVAQTQPPSLSAITQLSVNDDSYQGTPYAGGILNTGFAVNWTEERVDSAMASVDPEGEPPIPARVGPSTRS
jgi:predicted acyl esterase